MKITSIVTMMWLGCAWCMRGNDGLATNADTDQGILQTLQGLCGKNQQDYTITDESGTVITVAFITNTVDFLKSPRRCLKFLYQ